MIERNIAKRYARALLAVAQDAKKDAVDAFAAQLDAFAAACKSSPALLETLANRYFDLFARERIVDELAKKLSLDEAVRNFIKLLIHKGRIALFPVIRETYREFADRMMGREVMTVVSAAELPAAQYDALREGFGKITGKTMVLERKLLPEVLGGLRVHVRDKVYDYTVQNQLEQMKQRLLA